MEQELGELHTEQKLRLSFTVSLQLRAKLVDMPTYLGWMGCGPQ